MSTENYIDEMVLLTQEWLNRNYATKYGYTLIEENGQTGWDTIIALTTALQIELGISEPTGYFGPQTASLFNSLSINSNPDEGDTSPEAYSLQNQIYIIQGALWCKGYNPGGFTGYFGEGTQAAIIQMQTDAGLLNPDGVIDTVIMKALLSMDTFQLLEYIDTVDPKIREIQQALNRDYISNSYFRNDLGLIPCDGIYGRKTNQALIYALQIEEGISEPTGYFGPATRDNCPYLTLGTENKFVQLLQYALYCNGKDYDPTGFTGYYGYGTQAAVLNFQEFTCLSMSGNAGMQTWSSLLTSTGDPSREGTACDCATVITSERAQTLKSNGYKSVGRYLTGKFELTPAEINTILNAGLTIFPIFETWGYELSYFNKNQGLSDAYTSTKAAINLGFPENTVIYFAVDFDALDSDVTSSVIPYFEGLNEWFNENSIYKIGIYAPRNVCIRVSENGLSCSSFVCDMSTGFSGNLGYPLPKDWSLDQISIKIIGYGSGEIEIDNNICRYDSIGVSSINSHTDEFPLLLKQLDNICNEYYNSADVLLSTKNTTVLDILRYYEYRNFEWLLTVPTEVEGFMIYLSDQYPYIKNALLPYIKESPNSVTAYLSSKGTDIRHVAATALGYITSPLVPDFWTGWGGDLATAMADVTRLKTYDEYQYTSVETLAEMVIGSNFYTCSRMDIENDIDAIYIANNIKNNTIGNMLDEYFATVDGSVRRNILLQSLGFTTIPTLKELDSKINNLMTGLKGFSLPASGILGLKHKAKYNSIEPTDEVINETCMAFSKYILNNL